MLQSPGIQIFESSVAPAAEVVANTNGVATLGYSTRGPLNTLVRLESLTDFANIFGDPISGYEHAHILANNILSQNNPVYFMRIGSSDAVKATCPAVNVSLLPVNVAIAQAVTNPSYFILHSSSSSKLSMVAFKAAMVSAESSLDLSDR